MPNITNTIIAPPFTIEEHLERAALSISITQGAIAHYKRRIDALTDECDEYRVAAALANQALVQIADLIRTDPGVERIPRQLRTAITVSLEAADPDLWQDLKTNMQTMARALITIAHDERADPRAVARDTLEELSQ